MATPKVPISKKGPVQKEIKAKGENAPINKKEIKEVKKLDDVKDTPENKAAIAESEGKVVDAKEIEKTKEMIKTTLEADPNKIKENIKKEMGKAESKVAVEKVSKKDKKDKVELEREYVVPLRRGFLNVPRYRRAKKAVRVLKEFMVRHMNVRDGDLKKIKIDGYLNNELWFRGIKKPMGKVKVRAKKIDGIVYVELAEIPDVVRYAKAREEKRKMAAEKIKPKKIKAEKEDEVADKDKDGVDDKKEEAESKKAGAEKAMKVEKAAAKELKHTAQGKHMKKTMPVRKALKK